MFFKKQDFINKNKEIIDELALGLMKKVVPELETNGYAELAETINASRGIINALCDEIRNRFENSGWVAVVGSRKVMDEDGYHIFINIE
jgi:hypothetical protein